MRITKLHVQGVRRHTDLDIAPAPGLTIIRGPNEAGKSTVQTAIEMALFRKCTSTARELQDLRTWGSTDDPSVRLDFEHEGRPGHLVKHFAGARGSVELSLDGRVSQDPGEVDDLVTDITGLASEKFLRSTASVRHQELVDLDKDEAALRDRLQQSISGADQGTQTARRRLNEIVRRYRTEGTRNPGLLRRERDSLERLRTELAAGEAALAQLERDRTTLALAHDRRVELDARLARDQDAVDQGERAVRLETSATDAEARYFRLRQAVDLQGRITAAERDHAMVLPLPELRDAAKRVQELQFQIQELEVTMELRGDLPETTEVIKPPRWQPVALLSMIAFVAALIAAGAGVLGIVPAEIGLVLGLVLLVAAGGLGIWGARMARRVHAVRIQAQLQEAEIARRLAGRSREEEQLKETRSERDALLVAMGVPDVYAADALLERETAHGAAIDEIRAELRGVLAGVSVSGDLAAERDRAAAEMDQSRHALSGLGGVSTDPAAARERALRTLRQTQAERETAIQEEGQAQGRVDQNTIDADHVATTAEAVAATEERLAGMERRLRVYELTLSVLDAAEGHTVKKAARYLEEHMDADIARITDGRYRQVQVNEQDLSFRVWSPERDDWIPVQQLSQGTLDQVYLVARLGLVRQVTQERNPPLIFDDPFVTFDDDRARRAAELLRDLARDHQVLFLTTSDRYDRVADAVIELPAPLARDVDGPRPERVPAEATTAITASASVASLTDATPHEPLAAALPDAQEPVTAAWPDPTTTDTPDAPPTADEAFPAAATATTVPGWPPETSLEDPPAWPSPSSAWGTVTTDGPAWPASAASAESTDGPAWPASAASATSASGIEAPWTSTAWSTAASDRPAPWATAPESSETEPASSGSRGDGLSG
ncbi:MAG: AAA family ATPase [Chloroflexi bacterium]|nr:AAA family ATPase [Chloroflexota bacterium]